MKDNLFINQIYYGIKRRSPSKSNKKIFLSNILYFFDKNCYFIWLIFLQPWKSRKNRRFSKQIICVEFIKILRMFRKNWLIECSKWRYIEKAYWPIRLWWRTRWNNRFILQNCYYCRIKINFWIFMSIFRKKNCISKISRNNYIKLIYR